MSLLFVRPVHPEGQGERLLLAAIIRRAAFDIALYRGTSSLPKRQIWENAYHWMFSDQPHHFTSFVSICTLLDQNPVAIRRKTLRLTRNDVRKYDMVDAYGRI